MDDSDNIPPPTEEDFERARFQVFHQTKQYELAQIAHPLCLSECVPKNANRKQVFTQEELTCANNCVSKYRMSLQVLLSFLSASGDMS